MRHGPSITMWLIRAGETSWDENDRLRGDEELAERARVLLRFVRRAMSEPGVIPPKFTEHRIASPLGHPMISLGVAQVHRSSIGGGEADGVAADAAREIADVFLQPGLEAVLEVLPCMRRPTVARLAGEGFAVRAAVLRADFPEMVDRIRAAGGTDLVVGEPRQVIP